MDVEKGREMDGEVDVEKGREVDVEKGREGGWKEGGWREEGGRGEGAKERKGRRESTYKLSFINADHTIVGHTFLQIRQHSG